MLIKLSPDTNSAWPLPWSRQSCERRLRIYSVTPEKMRALTAELSAQLRASTQEVTALSERLQRAETEALLDALTGLRNRRGFEQSANEIARQRGDLGGAALLMADIALAKQICFTVSQSQIRHPGNTPDRAIGETVLRDAVPAAAPPHDVTAIVKRLL